MSERVFDVEEMLEWVKTGEAALSGTAAVLAGVGTLIYRGTEHRVAAARWARSRAPFARSWSRFNRERRPTGTAGSSAAADQRARRSVFFAILVVVVVQVIVVIILVVFVVPIFVVFFFLLGVFFGLGARPALGLLGEFQVEFRPAVDVQFLDVAVEMLNLDDFRDLRPL